MSQERRKPSVECRADIPSLSLSRLTALQLVAAPALSSLFLGALATDTAASESRLGEMMAKAARLLSFNGKPGFTILIGAVAVSLTWLLIRRGLAARTLPPQADNTLGPASLSPGEQSRPPLQLKDWALLYGFNAVACSLITTSMWTRGATAGVGASPLSIPLLPSMHTALGLGGSCCLLLGLTQLHSMVARATLTPHAVVETEKYPVRKEEEEWPALWAATSLHIAINSVPLAYILQSSLYGYSAIGGGLGIFYFVGRWFTSSSSSCSSGTTKRLQPKESLTFPLLASLLPGTSLGGQCWFSSALCFGAWNVWSTLYGASSTPIELLFRPAAEVVPTAACLHMLLYCGLDWRRCIPNIQEVLAVAAIAGTAVFGTHYGLLNMAMVAKFYAAVYAFVKFLSFTSQGALALALEDPY